MATDTFHTVSPGFYDHNSPETLFPQDSGKKTQITSPSENTAVKDNQLINGFLDKNMNNLSDNPDFTSLMDPEDPVGGFIYPTEQCDTSIEDMFKIQNKSNFKEEEEDDVLSTSDISRSASPAAGTFSPRQTLGDNMMYENTTMSIIHRSADLHLDDHAADGSTFWSVSQVVSNTDKELSNRVQKKSVCDNDLTNMSVFDDPDACPPRPVAMPSSDFVFTKFGQMSQAEDDASPSSVSGVLDSDAVSSTSCHSKRGFHSKAVKSPQFRTIKKLKEPPLNLVFPAKVGDRELKILSQPEEQHRARYLTEGSRGAIKDRSQNGYPVVQLCGYEEPATLQIFIGNDSGKTKPHGFYQACQVCGKNASQSTSKDVDGTTVIEIKLDKASNMTATVDCVGILKLRNADVEQRIGLARSKKKKVPTATLR